MIKPVTIFVCLLQLCLVSCRAQVPGCTDPLANNYNPSATRNDGSCIYDPISVSPATTMNLNENISETSGLSFWEGYLWTHNDNEDTKLYGLDTTNADIKIEYLLQGVTNNDWEDVSQDMDFLYIGDFGNNVSGNRTDLNILRIEKNTLISGDPLIDTIWFTYNDQFDFEPAEANTSDFDCEAFIISEDSIYLFTKQWSTLQTSVYVLPKTPGSHIAMNKGSYNIQGLITGASYLEPYRLVVLCGYTSLLHPFLYLLYDFYGHDFFSGNKRRVTVSLPFHQVEGIASSNGLKYYISNEAFKLQLIANSPQKLHILNMTDLLQDYLLETSSGNNGIKQQTGILLYPNPASDLIHVEIDESLIGKKFYVIDQTGRKILSDELASISSTLDLSHLMAGFYIFLIGEIVQPFEMTKR